MSDVLIKLIGLMIGLVVLIVAPITIATGTATMTDQRMVLNHTQTYLDIVTDKGELTPTDLENFLDDLHTTDLIYEVTVVREQRLVYQTEVKYIPTTVVGPRTGRLSTVVPMNAGDIVRVHVEAINTSPGSKISATFLKLHTPDIDVTLSRVNRN